MEDLQEEMDRVRIFCLTKQLELQEVVKNVVGGEQLCLMYSQLLQNYANVKKEYFVFGKRYDDLAASHYADRLTTPPPPQPQTTEDQGKDGPTKNRTPGSTSGPFSSTPNNAQDNVRKIDMENLTKRLIEELDGYRPEAPDKKEEENRDPRDEAAKLEELAAEKRAKETQLSQDLTGIWGQLERLEKENQRFISTTLEILGICRVGILY